jgi:hypothetical protein
MNPAALRAALSGDMENFVVASTPGGIEAQEKRGQIEQSFAETLPIEGTEKREAWERLGFVFGKTVDGIFVQAKFPKGWRKQPTDHSMWSNLLDDKDRKRGMIFYKAAFYDRSAHVNLERRFSCGSCPVEGWNSKEKSGRFVGVVTDGEAIIHQTEPTAPEPQYNRGDNSGKREDWLEWLRSKELKQQEAKAWLDAKYPNHGDASAYWE